MRLEALRARCELDDCEWCDHADRRCRHCGGAGRWRPEAPCLDANGVIGWTRVEEPCRMCAGTGKEHNPL